MFKLAFILTMPIFLLTACMLNTKPRFPKKLLTKKQIYNNFYQNKKTSVANRIICRRPYSAFSDYSVAEKLDYSAHRQAKLIRRLSNPDLLIYIFPHRSGPEQSLIPAYTTVFPMYTQVHYAMPGEIAVPNRHDLKKP